MYRALLSLVVTLIGSSAIAAESTVSTVVVDAPRGQGQRAVWAIWVDLRPA